MTDDQTDSTKIRTELGDIIAGIDLNLLKVFEAIIAEGSVSRAASRLSLSQSATSHSLSRLREIVNDPLFERKGHGVQPTPKAIEIAEPILAVLHNLRDVLRKNGGVFDPLRERRSFTIDIPAGIDIAVAPELVRISEKAPGISFRIMTSRANLVLTELRYGHSALAIDYEPTVEKGFRSETIVEDEFVVVARKGHPALKNGITAELYQRLPQVAVAFTRRDDNSPIANRLRDIRTTRNVQMVVSSMPTVSAVVQSSDMIASASRGIATLLTKQFGIEIHPIPIVVPPLPITMVWHEQFEMDPGHIWLRERISSIFRGI